jgi:hypothetical protein
MSINTDKKEATTITESADLAKEMAEPQKAVRGALSDFLKDNPVVKNPKVPLELQPDGKDAHHASKEDYKEESGHYEQGGKELKKTNPLSRNPKGFVTRTKAEVAEYKQKYEAAEIELREFKEKKLPELENQVKELSSKASSAATGEEFEKTKRLLDEVTEERDRTKASLEETTSTIKFLDLQRDPSFRRDFVVPVHNNRAAINKIVSGNPEQESMVDRAISAHAAAMQAGGVEDKERHEKARDAIFQEVYRDLPDMQRGKFDNAVNRYIESTEFLTSALLNHANTTRQYEEKRREAAEEGKNKVKDVWMKALGRTGEPFKVYENLTEEDAAIAKELGVDFDIKEDTELARSIIDPDENVSEDKATTLLNKGRVHNVLVAKNKILQKRLDDALGLLSRYRGSSKINTDTTTGTLKEPKPEKAEGFAKFMSKFQPN